jgi:large subunit ribosomal protein L25
MSKSKTKQKIVLETSPREGVGSRVSRRLRRDGKVPVNVYGHGQANAHLCVDAHAFDLALNTATQIFTLTVGGQSESCLLTELQYDTFGQQILHADFERVDLTEEVEVEVHLEFIGTAKGVNAGGTLVVHHPTVAVKCRADSIPDLIEVDVSGLDMHEGIHAGELTLAAGVSLDTHEMDAETQIVGVVAPQAEEEPAAEEGAEPELVSGDAADKDDKDGDAKKDDD